MRETGGLHLSPKSAKKKVVFLRLMRAKEGRFWGFKNLLMRAP
jgi:hypothetical protein